MRLCVYHLGSIFTACQPTIQQLMSCRATATEQQHQFADNATFHSNQVKSWLETGAHGLWSQLTPMVPYFMPQSSAVKLAWAYVWASPSWNVSKDRCGDVHEPNDNGRCAMHTFAWPPTTCACKTGPRSQVNEYKWKQQTQVEPKSCVLPCWKWHNILVPRALYMTFARTKFLRMKAVFATVTALYVTTVRFEDQNFDDPGSLYHKDLLESLQLSRYLSFHYYI